MIDVLSTVLQIPIVIGASMAIMEIAVREGMPTHFVHLAVVLCC